MMSTKSSIYYAEDESGVVCHIYWELAEREGKHGRMTGSPLYISLVHRSKLDESPTRLSPEIALRICKALGKLPDFEII